MDALTACCDNSEFSGVVILKTMDASCFEDLTFETMNVLKASHFEALTFETMHVLDASYFEAFIFISNTLV